MQDIYLVKFKSSTSFFFSNISQCAKFPETSRSRNLHSHFEIIRAHQTHFSIDALKQNKRTKYNT